jgi:hypothetical protein
VIAAATGKKAERALVRRKEGRKEGGPQHGPLKLRTVHFSDNTIIYESKASVKLFFP